VIVNLYAVSVAEYVELTERLDQADGIDGFEVNLSCPNVAAGGVLFGRDPVACGQVTEAVRRVTDKLVAIKLTPASVVADIARACADAGADALSVANTIPTLEIDVDRCVPRLANGIGGLSGPALRHIAVRMVHEARQAVDLPIIGIGGIASGEAAAEFMLAGACAVQVGTATFSDPNAVGGIRDGLVAYLERQHETAARDIVGTLTMA